MAKTDPKKEKLLIQVLKKIPIFNGLAPSQVRKILALCAHKSYAPGDTVCESGTAPDEMFVLLSGEVGIITHEGLKVATVLPVTMVGEMGVMTGQPRVATVEVTKPSAMFVIQKMQFDAVLRDDDDIRSKVYRAIIDVLSGKLTNDNVRLRDYQQEKSRYEGQIAVLERRLTEQESRAGIALDLAAEASGRERDELELHIDEQVKDLIPRVLIVDDEVEFRALVRDGLPRFEVLEAGDGMQALEIIGEEKLDLIITDIRMPEMDGIQLLEALRAQYPNLPVLATSGYMDATEAASHSFDGFIEKPLALEPMQQIVEATLGRADGKDASD
ncbi:MAG: response regulator [Gemmatimonadetes bacterium]|jgi:CheY-like chemotaxis protein|nr:response regulator [Gemmatimonadota bacterium]